MHTIEILHRSPYRDKAASGVTAHKEQHPPPSSLPSRQKIGNRCPRDKITITVDCGERSGTGHLDFPRNVGDENLWRLRCHVCGGHRCMEMFIVGVALSCRSHIYLSSLSIW
ncbi:hypothetical protein BaRGS_00012896 [Batillaria attramentaria]|uniref:Uncharacterized protein n=1 Tax=Batillaria attramentaria TaxID=370345 RepID=A0ABD0L9E5_9CAEN